MTLDEIRAGIDLYGLKYVADKIGHDHSTVWRIVTGETKRPSYEIVSKLVSFLQERKDAQKVKE